jgi:hypothetical protein
MTGLHPDTPGSTAPMRRQRGMPEASDGLERVAHDLAAQRWIFAKTIPENPHEYTLRREWRSDTGFVRAVRFIRDHGYRNLFEGRWYTQLDIGAHTYWTMGAPVEETILINRKKIAPAPGARA